MAEEPSVRKRWIQGGLTTAWHPALVFQARQARLDRELPSLMNTDSDSKFFGTADTQRLAEILPDLSGGAQSGFGPVG